MGPCVPIKESSACQRELFLPCCSLLGFQHDEPWSVGFHSDHIFCFSADLVTMKRPPSFLCCMQASTGYVENKHAPLLGVDTVT